MEIWFRMDAHCTASVPINYITRFTSSRPKHVASLFVLNMLPVHFPSKLRHNTDVLLQNLTSVWDELPCTMIFAVILQKLQS